MSNKLFQLAEAAVHRAETSSHAIVNGNELREAKTKIAVAKNDVSSAYANSTTAEKEQLRELQDRLEQCEQYIEKDHRYV